MSIPPSMHDATVHIALCTQTMITQTMIYRYIPGLLSCRNDNTGLDV
jgi:hypothetical protein